MRVVAPRRSVHASAGHCRTLVWTRINPRWICACTQALVWEDDFVTLAVEVLRMRADATHLQLAGLLLDHERSFSGVGRVWPATSSRLATSRTIPRYTPFWVAVSSRLDHPTSF